MNELNQFLSLMSLMGLMGLLGWWALEYYVLCLAEGLEACTVTKLKEIRAY